MNLTQSLASLALLPMLIGPAFANPCVACRKVAVKKVAVKEVIVKKEVAAIGFQVAVPVYLAQVVPAPNITYNLTTPPLPAQPTQAVTTYSAPTVISPIVGANAYAGASSYYGGQQQPQQLQQTDALASALDRINQRLCVLEEKMGVPVKKMPDAAVDVLPLGIDRCARCHNGTEATTKGGGFVLFEMGTLAKLTDRQLRLMDSHVADKTMPPPSNALGIKPLTDQEASSFREWIKGQQVKK